MIRYGIISCIVCILTGCNTPSAQLNTDGLDTLVLKKGDILFREGMGFTSRLIKLMDNECCYTHVGILTDSAGQWMVIHSVPDEPDYPGDSDRVKMEPLKEFYGFGKAASGAIMRPYNSLKAQHAADIAYQLYRRGIPFDHAYDDTDTTSMYCTEFVNHIFTQAGDTLIAAQKRISQRQKRRNNYLFPSDIYQSKSLFKIINF